MKIRSRLFIRWFPVALAVIGGMVFTAGIFVAASSMIVPVSAQQHINLPLYGAVYVGANTCYTCHSDEADDWSLTLYAQTIVNPAVKPKVVLTDLSLAEEIHQMNVDDMADASTTQDSGTLESTQFPQHYIIKTEEGHTVLPEQWSEMSSEKMKLEEPPILCGGCHSIDFAQEHLSIGAIARTFIPDAGTDTYRLVKL